MTKRNLIDLLAEDAVKHPHATDYENLIRSEEVAFNAVKDAMEAFDALSKHIPEEAAAHAKRLIGDLEQIAEHFALNREAAIRLAKGITNRH